MNAPPDRNAVAPALRLRHDLFMAVTNALRLTADAAAPPELAELLARANGQAFKFLEGASRER